ncbi:retrovirus-related pol polyprotein from transposon TNT 1-94 [Tanacetum coccineum]
MENEHELSYETLTRVYLGSYEHYKSVGAEVEYLEPGFELQGAKMVEMGRHMEHLEGDVGSLYDELLRLKASLDVLFVPCYAAAERSHQGGHVASIWTKGKLKQVGKLLRRVKELVMEVLAHGKSFKWTYVKSKDIDLWQVIQNGDFYFEVEDEETKLMKETPYELLKDTEKKQLGNNEEAKMTIYNALPRKEYERNCKFDLLTQEYEKFSISNEETINSGFTRFNAIVTSLESLNPDYSSKNHFRKFLHTLLIKWRAKMTAIEEAKDLATLPLDELIGNLMVYEMVLDNDGVASKTTKEKFKSLALKSKVTREQTSDNSICQVKGKEGKSSRREHECYNYDSKNHLASNCPKPNNKAFVGVTWSDSEDDDEPQNNETCLMANDSQEVWCKQVHASHKLINMISTTRVLELLHMDLFGSSSIQSYGGNFYTLVIVDDYSRYTWTLFLKTKNEAFDKFKALEKNLQNLLGHLIVLILTDHGREFDNEVQFVVFCNKHGISPNFSAPRTPQSNGVVERKSRTLQEMSRTMLNEQFIP